MAESMVHQEVGKGPAGPAPALEESEVRNSNRGATPSSARPAPAPPAAPGEAKVVYVYDGIEEQDNHLPNWWLYTLFITCIFALGYWFHYHVFHAGELPGQAYQREMAAVYAAEAARVRAAGQMTPQALLALSRDEATVAQGRQVFATTCAACHGPTGGGVIGPNLTDAFWINGGAPDRIYRTINEGVPARGMPAWGPQLGAERVQAVTAYVLTLRNTNVAGGKAPQGEREE
jgi:cytochrome c oxidase cbb3-type subunit 3